MLCSDQTNSKMRIRVAFSTCIGVQYHSDFYIAVPCPEFLEERKMIILMMTGAELLAMWNSLLLGQVSLSNG